MSLLCFSRAFPKAPGGFIASRQNRDGLGCFGSISRGVVGSRKETARHELRGCQPRWSDGSGQLRAAWSAAGPRPPPLPGPLGSSSRTGPSHHAPPAPRRTLTLIYILGALAVGISTACSPIFACLEGTCPPLIRFLFMTWRCPKDQGHRADSVRPS